ncbi:MAG: glycine oxidase ThiO [Solirubrobacteraceae bacterium]
MTTEERSFDVAIVGAGVIGLAVGWRAARRGLGVVVLERGAAGRGTSHFAAGMIAPIAEATPSEPALLELGLQSARLYPDFVAGVRERSGIDPLYRQFGTLLVARDRDEAEALERERAFREQLGLPVRRLLASEARRLEPALSPSLRLALEIPDDHAVDPRRLTAALAVALRADGGELRSGAEVSEVLLAGERVRGVRIAGGATVSAGAVVIAAGPWSGGVAGLPVHARVPLRPVKGQIMRLRDPAGPGLLSRVLRMQPGYLVPRGDGRYVLGATMEERGFDTTVTVEAVHTLLRDAVELVPGVTELVIDETGAAIRPGTPDNMPMVGPGALGGLYWATGHHRHGFLLAPVTAEMMARELAGEAPSELSARFAPGRFVVETAA